MITLPQTRKGIFFGLGAALLLVLLVSVFTMTEFFGLYTPESSAADYNISCNSTTVTSSSYSSADNLVFQDGGDGICIIDGVLSINSATVDANVTLTHAAATGDGVDITTVGNFVLSSNATIDVDGKGCQPNTGNNDDGDSPNPSNVCGPSGTSDFYSGGGQGGSGSAGQGAGHGGAGGDSTSSLNQLGQIYDSQSNPTLFGSSGGTGSNAYGGAGGGLVVLDIGGTLTLDGNITSDGDDGLIEATARAGGGGSGGSISVTADTIAGNGTLSVDGGAGGDNSSVNGGGGGGGIILLSYDTDSGFSPSSGDFSASGGVGPDGADDGGPGIVYVTDSAGTGPATDDDVTIFYGFHFDDTDWSVGSWTIDSTVVQDCISGSSTPSITASGNISLNGSLDCQYWVTSLGFNSTGGDVTIASGVVYSMASTDLIDIDAVNFTLSSSATIDSNLDLTTSGDAEIQSGAVIDTYERGCPAYLNLDGYSPDASNNCGPSGTGGYNSGGGEAGSGSQGGGHGGAGGDGTASPNTLGATYDSSSNPQLFGSGGGSSSGGVGGYGGGLVLMDIGGTLTHNGSIVADGADGLPNATAQAGAGGSGGSINISANTLTGSGTLSAIGGDGADNSSNDGGGGGGGLVYYSYLTGPGSVTCDTTGGTGPGTATDGGDGNCESVQTNDPPTITNVTISPSTSVSYGTPVSVSVTATDDLGIDQIKIWVDNNLDGDFADSGELEVTCNYSSDTTAICQSPSEVYSRTSTTDHAVKIEVTDSFSSVASDDSTYSFSVSGETSSNVIDLGRQKAGETTTFGLSFELSGPSTGTLDVSFPQGFVISDPLVGPTSNSPCLSGATRVSSVDFRMTKTACSGTISFSGLEVTNPSSTGSYTITWTNDNGSGEVYIVDDDQVTINANVEQSMTFDLDLGTASTADNGSPYTLDLGILESISITGSEDSAKNGIWVDIGSNATAGVVITVKSANAALQSTAVPSDEIASGAVSVGSEGYGICVASGGVGVPAATDGTLQAVTPFNSTCTTSSWTVGTLTGSTQSILNSNSLPLYEGRAQIRVAASIASTTPAHDDYADTLTFIATSTY